MIVASHFIINTPVKQGVNEKNPLRMAWFVKQSG